jgi:hypothetical protein
MDTFGSIDPYAMLFFEGLEHRTETIKNSYNPEWNQTFTCVFTDCSKMVRSDFVVQVNDWDATSKDDEVGSFTIPAARMSEILRAKLGSEGQETFTLYLEGKPVVGQDKELSQITVKVRVLEAPKAFATLELDGEARGARRLDVTLISAKHLPKVVLASRLSCITCLCREKSPYVSHMYDACTEHYATSLQALPFHWLLFCCMRSFTSFVKHVGCCAVKTPFYSVQAADF